MRLLLALIAAALFLAACGKKAPLRVPQEPHEESQFKTDTDETYS